MNSDHTRVICFPWICSSEKTPSSFRLHSPTSKKDVLRLSLFWPEKLVSGSFSECLWFGECQSRAFFFECPPRRTQQGQRSAGERWGGAGSPAYTTEVIGGVPSRVLGLAPRMARNSFQPRRSVSGQPLSGPWGVCRVRDSDTCLGLDPKGPARRWAKTSRPVVQSE